MAISDSTSQMPAEATRKRKLSSGVNGAGRAIKRRASQACHPCRMRKVRCDVLANGTRCTNCRLDNTECVVLASRRGRKPTTSIRGTDNHGHGSRPSDITPRPPTRDIRPHTASTEEVDKSPDHDSVAALALPSSTGDVPVCVTFDEDSQVEGQTSEGHDKNFSTSHGAQSLPTPERWPFERSDSAAQRPIGTSSLSNHSSPANNTAAPSFAIPLSNEIPKEDLEFLVHKGVFIIPEPRLRAEILKCYMFTVHPFLPLLDLPVVANAILRDDGGDHISFLLFQAIMFAGLASLELQYVRELGFESTKQAREVFFNRAKLLYEFDVEPDETAVLQSLILMSWWYGRWDKRKHTWHWTGLAVSVAQNMGLHREPTPRCGSEKARKLRRRLWWSLYIRDRLLALGTRRPMRISDDMFDVAMLRAEDFDDNDGSKFAGDHQLHFDHPEDKTRTVTMCIELAKLCVCIGHVLSSQYTALKTLADVPHTTMVVPKRMEDRRANELETCDKEIDEWFHSLAPDMRKPGRSSAQDGVYTSSEVQCIMLNVIYYTLINVLHRTQALQVSSKSAGPREVSNNSRSKVKDSARNVTKLTYAMLRCEQFRHLGLPGVTALVASCLSHMLDIRSGDEDVRDASIFRFYQSMQVLQALRGIYASADSAVSFLSSVIRKAGISVPAHVVAPAPDFMSASNASGNSTAPQTAETIGSNGTPMSFYSRRYSAAHRQSNDSPQAIGTSTSPSRSTTEGPKRTINGQPDPLLLPTSESVHSYSFNGGHTSTTLPNPAPLPNYPLPYSDSERVSSSTGGQAIPQQLGKPQHLELFSSSYPTFGPLVDWNSALDFGSYDNESVAFDYDFSSDAFGFLSGESYGAS